MNSNLITIVIATYNAEEYLQTCLNSIIPQLNSDVELIIIDGESKDGTIGIIKNNQQHVKYWISERDRGIYDAWNKGIEKAKGNWIMFIGADDQLMPNGINIYKNFISENVEADQVDFISSRVKMIDLDGNSIRIKGWSFSWPLFLKEMTVAHPGALHSKKIFLTYGKYNIDYKIVGDYELLLRAGKNLRALYIHEVTVIMSEGGASDSVKSIKEHYKAVTSTTNYPKYLAFKNAVIVYIKFKIKKMGRKIGLNLYLRKS